MKTKSIICALLIVALLLSGCSLPDKIKLKGINDREDTTSAEKTNVPAIQDRPDGCEGAVLDFLEALKAGKRNEVRLFSEEVPGFTGIYTHPLYTAAYNSLSWKLLGFKEGKKGYELTVELTVRDMRPVLARLSERVMQEQTPGCSRVRLCNQLLEEVLAEEPEMLCKRTSLTLSKVTGSWRVLNAESFYNLACGYLSQALKEFDLPTALSEDSPMEDADRTFEQRVFASGGCTVTVLGTFPNAPDGYTILLRCDNRSGQEKIFSARNLIVNGYVIETDRHFSVPSGETKTESVAVPRGLLERCGIEKVRNIRFLAETFSTHAWPVYPEYSVQCIVYPHGRDDTREALVSTEGQHRLLDSWCSGVTVLDVVDEGCWGCTVYLAVDNRTEQELWFGIGELSVDGREFDPGFSVLLPGYCMGVKELRIPAGELLAHDAEGVDSLDFRVFVSDLVNLDKKDEGISAGGRYTLQIGQ